MLELADIGQIAWVAPLAFLLGIGVGLGLASKFRIIKRPEEDDDDRT